MSEETFSFEDDNIDESSLPIDTSDERPEPTSVHGLEISDAMLCRFAHSFANEEHLFHAACLADPPLPDVVAVQVLNHVVHARLSEEVNWSLIVNGGMRFGFHFAPGKFGATDICLTNPRTTVRCHPTTLCCNGADNILDAIFGMQLTIAAIRAITDETGILLHADLRCLSVRIVNVCGIINLGFGVQVEQLKHYPFVKHDPLDWKASHIRVGELAPDLFPDRNVNAMINRSGNINISGARSRAEIATVYALVIQIVQKHTSRATLEKHEDRLRKRTEDLRYTNSLPEDSLALVRIRHSVADTAPQPRICHTEESAMQSTQLALARRVVAVDSFTRRDNGARLALLDQIDQDIAPSSSKHTRLVPAQEAYNLALNSFVDND